MRQTSYKSIENPKTYDSGNGPIRQSTSPFTREITQRLSKPIAQFHSINDQTADSKKHSTIARNDRNSLVN